MFVVRMSTVNYKIVQVIFIFGVKTTVEMNITFTVNKRLAEAKVMFRIGHDKYKFR